MDRKRKYTLNENYFEKIDTEEKAYWLGFILADGYIGLRNGKESALEIVLAKKDLDHLHKFKNAIGYGGPVYLIKNDSMCRLNVYGLTFVGHIVDKGIGTKKSLISKPIFFEEDSLQKAFWRGCFDGDGTVFWAHSKIRASRLSLGIIGTKDICEAFSIYVKKHCPTQSNNLEKRPGCYRWLMTGNKYCKIFLEHLYKDASIFLDRKEKFSHVA